MLYTITHKTFGSFPHVEALVSDAAMTDPSILPSDWPVGSIIYTTGFATIKTKGLDGSWTEVE